MARPSKGAAGELFAARYLREHGYQIVAANYRCRLGEVDMIAQDGAYIAFVEVKTRREDALYAPRAAVTADERPLKQVADDLGISLRMVQRHLTSIYSKTDTQTRAGLTRAFFGK